MNFTKQLVWFRKRPTWSWSQYLHFDCNIYLEWYFFIVNSAKGLASMHLFCSISYRCFSVCCLFAMYQVITGIVAVVRVVINQKGSISSSHMIYEFSKPTEMLHLMIESLLFTSNVIVLAVKVFTKICIGILTKVRNGSAFLKSCKYFNRKLKTRNPSWLYAH